MSEQPKDSERVALLRKRLAARKNVPGYEKNCEHIEAEIARLTMGALDL